MRTADATARNILRPRRGRPSIAGPGCRWRGRVRCGMHSDRGPPRPGPVRCFPAVTAILWPRHGDASRVRIRPGREGFRLAARLPAASVRRPRPPHPRRHGQGRHRSAGKSQDKHSGRLPASEQGGGSAQRQFTGPSTQDTTPDVRPPSRVGDTPPIPPPARSVPAALVAVTASIRRNTRASLPVSSQRDLAARNLRRHAVLVRSAVPLGLDHLALDARGGEGAAGAG